MCPAGILLVKTNLVYCSDIVKIFDSASIAVMTAVYVVQRVDI